MTAKQKFKGFRSAATMGAVLLLITACGGGGDSSSGQSNGNAARTVYPDIALPSFCSSASNTTSPYRFGSYYKSVEETQSVARVWNEEALESVRRDFPRPTVHSRNLFHVSAAMYDAWSAYDKTSTGYFYTGRHTAANVDQARREAMSFAAYHLLSHRASLSFDAEASQLRLARRMETMGFNPCYNNSDGNSAAQLGNYIAKMVVAKGKTDGSNEGSFATGGVYKDTSGWKTVNANLKVAEPYTLGLQAFPDQFQLLEMAQAQSQNGIATSNMQSFVTPHWGQVTPFSMVRASGTAPYFTPTALPAWNTAAMRSYALEIVTRTAQLGVNDMDDVSIDISPAAMGNSALGTNAGQGYAKNPITNEAYPANAVSRNAFGRWLAEYWADGPNSETPPGHWNLIANQVADNAAFVSYFDTHDRLEWETKTYFALNAALYDVGISAWEIKRLTNTARPISLIRHMAALGQSSDPKLASYNANGIPLVPGIVELITEDSLKDRHAGLDGHVGEVAIYSFSPSLGNGGIILPSRFAWKLGSLWSPYQPANFVTPAFPGMVSGHSTFSRAAAEVLTARTGSAYFPGGFMELTVSPFSLKSSSGPVSEFKVQIATFYDASDLSGLSRLWGGIHIQPDDLEGRKIGSTIGQQVAKKAQTYFDGSAGK